jgi:integrase
MRREYRDLRDRKEGERAGLGHWHPHELRHSGASLSFAQGVQARAIMDVLGHAEIGVTMNTIILRSFARRPPTPLTNCSESEVSGFGSVL